MAHQKTERQIDRDNRFGKPLEWLTAAVIGLGAGTYALYSSVANKFHRDVSDDFDLLKVFRERNPASDIRANFETHLKDHGEGFLKKYLSVGTKEQILGRLEKGIPAIPKPEVKDAAAKLVEGFSRDKSAYRRFVKLFQEEVLDFRAFGWRGITKGTLQRFGTFSWDSQWKIRLQALAAAGGAIGITLMIFNQLNTRDKLNVIDKQAGDNNRKLDALIEALNIEPPKTILPNPPKVEEQPSTKINASLAERENIHAAAGHAR